MTAQMKHLNEKGSVYWIRCQDGGRHLGRSVKEAESKFEAGEQGLSAIEGLALVAQMPELLTSQYLDLANSTHEGFENSTACLGTWSGNAELRWRWRDHEDPRCQTASQKI
jgi:hypothetical protein